MDFNKAQKTITISQSTGITVSLTLIIMFAGAIFTSATWIADMRNRITDVEKTSDLNATDIATLKSESTTTQVKFTEIQTQLKGIDATLLEIKAKL